eukprot:13347193-Heterocapsa_arctica.AAC.1
MQGDVPAPQKFSIVYDKLQEKTAQEGITFLEEQYLTFIEPIDLTQHLADHVRYADDLLTVGLANYFEQVCWRLKDWKDMWVKHTLRAWWPSFERIQETGHGAVCWAQFQQGVFSIE